MIFFWFSMLMSPSLIPIGMLGPIFGLSVNDSIVITVFATVGMCDSLRKAWTDIAPRFLVRQSHLSQQLCAR